MKIVNAQTQTEIFAVINIRKDVFMIEQNVAVEEELDTLDYEARHFLIESNDTYVGTARIVYIEDAALIGRVAILKEHRNLGYGYALIEHLLNILKDEGYKKVRLGAQTHALGFYEKLGFKVYGPMYLDANIEHYDMELDLCA